MVFTRILCRGVLPGEMAREPQHAGLGRRVVHAQGRARGAAGVRREVDDAAPARCSMCGITCLQQRNIPLRFESTHHIPVCGRELMGHPAHGVATRRVHQHVDRPERAHGLLDHRLHGRPRHARRTPRPAPCRPPPRSRSPCAWPAPRSCPPRRPGRPPREVQRHLARDRPPRPRDHHHSASVSLMASPLDHLPSKPEQARDGHGMAGHSAVITVTASTAATNFHTSRLASRIGQLMTVVTT